MGYFNVTSQVRCARTARSSTTERAMGSRQMLWPEHHFENSLKKLLA
jgi:hypothetical protein